MNNKITHVVVDQEFKSLIPPLAKDEIELLEKNVVADGCRDPLVVWNGLLIDGHNRYEICTKHSIDFSTVELKLDDRQSAINWIIDNQLGRRNLHPDQASYLRGKRYNGEKLTHGGERESSYQNDNLKTHERLAEEYQVSSATITRDGQYAAAVDKLASVGIEPQAIIAHSSKSDVIELAKEIENHEPITSSLFEQPKQQEVKATPASILMILFAMRLILMMRRSSGRKMVGS